MVAFDVGAGYRALDADEILERGDQYYAGGLWWPTLFVGKPAKIGLDGFPYRRPIPVQQQTQFLEVDAAGRRANAIASTETSRTLKHFRDNEKAAVPSTLESDRLRAIVAKEFAHREIVAANTRGRDLAVEAGLELQRLRENFAHSFPDRLFVVGNRVVSTDDGRYDMRSAEVVSA